MFLEKEHLLWLEILTRRWSKEVQWFGAYNHYLLFFPIEILLDSQSTPLKMWCIGWQAKELVFCTWIHPWNFQQIIKPFWGNECELWLIKTKPFNLPAKGIQIWVHQTWLGKKNQYTVRKRCHKLDWCGWKSQPHELPASRWSLLLSEAVRPANDQRKDLFFLILKSLLSY